MTQTRKMQLSSCSNTLCIKKWRDKECFTSESDSLFLNFVPVMARKVINNIMSRFSASFFLLFCFSICKFCSPDDDHQMEKKKKVIQSLVVILLLDQNRSLLTTFYSTRFTLRSTKGNLHRRLIYDSFLILTQFIPSSSSGKKKGEKKYNKKETFLLHRFDFHSLIFLPRFSSWTSVHFSSPLSLLILSLFSPFSWGSLKR